MTEPIRKIRLKDGTERYRVVVDVGKRPDGRRAQRTRTFDTRRQARAWLAEVRTEVNRSVYVRPRRETVGEHLDSFLESKRLSGKRPATVSWYSDTLKPVRRLYGGKPLQELTADDVEAVKAAMLDGTARSRGQSGKPLSPRAINGTLTALQAALAQAVNRGKVYRNVAEVIDKMAGDTAPGAAWTSGEAARFKATSGRRPTPRRMAAHLLWPPPQ